MTSRVPIPIRLNTIQITPDNVVPVTWVPYSVPVKRIRLDPVTSIILWLKTRLRLLYTESSFKTYPSWYSRDYWNQHKTKYLYHGV